MVLFRIDAEGKDLLVDTDREKRNMQVKVKIIYLIVILCLLSDIKIIQRNMIQNATF